MIQVLVAGFRGAMGQKTVKMVQSHQDFALSAVFDPKITDLNPKSYNLPTNVQVLNTYDQLHAHVADVWVDFTNPSAVAANIEAAINAGIHPIVGTSGMDPANQERLIKLANAKHLGGLIAPNFGLSAVLLMKFAQAAAAYFPDAEIIEMHHQDKADAPSGTAIATAHKIAAGRTQKPLPTNVSMTSRSTPFAYLATLPTNKSSSAVPVKPSPSAKTPSIAKASCKASQSRLVRYKRLMNWLWGWRTFYRKNAQLSAFFMSVWPIVHVWIFDKSPNQ